MAGGQPTQPCGKLLKGVPPLWLPHLEEKIDEEVLERVLAARASNYGPIATNSRGAWTGTSSSVCWLTIS